MTRVALEPFLWHSELGLKGRRKCTGTKPKGYRSDVRRLMTAVSEVSVLNRPSPMHTSFVPNLLPRSRRRRRDRGTDTR